MKAAGRCDSFGALIMGSIGYAVYLVIVKVVQP
jgi:preprotein translocase subunit Sss1